MPGLTLQQLQAQGAKPVAQPLTLAQVLQQQKMGTTTTTPVIPPTPIKPTQDNGIIGSEKNFGNSIADAIAGGKSADIVSKNVQQHSQDLQKLTELSKQLKTAGKDTSHVDILIKKLNTEDPTSYGANLADIIPSVNKSTKQIVGETAGVGTDLLVASGALKPVVAGAAFGLTHALQQDKGVGGVLVDTALTALGGKIGEVGFKAVAPYISKVVSAYGTPILEKLSQYIPTDALPALQKLAEKATLGTGNGGSDLLDNTVNKIDGGINSANAALKTSLANKASVKADQTALEALNPDLTGKKLITAYKQTVIGGRDITPASVFNEQGLSPDKQTINLTKRLTQEIPLTDGTVTSKVQITKDPVKNLNALGSSLTDTENKITTLLQGDPTLQYNADKPGLFDKLNSVQEKMPQEFSAIKDSKNIFNKAVTFAKQVITDTPDTPMGLRDARTAFDSQAKKEFPSAFKEGSIDTKTPAGSAIKAIRDTINEHLYTTAPEGSDVQKLIGREADIFRAADTVAAKAAKTNGQNAVTKLIEAHPTLAKYAKNGLLLLGADKAIKGVTGFGI